MKTVKIIPVLMASMLISACTTTSNVKVSEPKFAKEGSEMKAEDFIKEFIEGVNPDTYETIYGPAIKDSEFFKKDKISSKEISGTAGTEQIVTLSRKDKEIEKTENRTLTKASIVGDTDNGIIKTQTKVESLEKFQQQTAKGEGRSSGKSTTWLQEGQVENNAGVIMAHEEEQYYTPFQTFNDYFKKDTWVSDSIKEQVQMMFGSLISGLTTAYAEKDLNPEELAKYKCYKNGSVYTITYVSKVEIDYEVLDVKYYHKVSELNNKYQLDVSKWTVKSSLKSVETRTYLKDSGSYYENDVQKVVNNQYADMSIASKTPKLKALDVTNFKFVKQAV